MIVIWSLDYVYSSRRLRFIPVEVSPVSVGYGANVELPAATLSSHLTGTAVLLLYFSCNCCSCCNFFCLFFIIFRVLLRVSATEKFGGLSWSVVCLAELGVLVCVGIGV